MWRKPAEQTHLAFLSSHWATIIHRWAVSQQNGRSLKIVTHSWHSVVAREHISTGMDQSSDSSLPTKNRAQTKKQKSNNHKKKRPSKTWRDLKHPDWLFSLAKFRLLFKVSSSTDPKTVTFICCSNTIMSKDCELNIPCSQIGQRQTQHYVPINRMKPPHFNTVLEQNWLFTHFRKRHATVKCYPSPKEHKIYQEVLPHSHPKV